MSLSASTRFDIILTPLSSLLSRFRSSGLPFQFVGLDTARSLLQSLLQASTSSSFLNISSDSWRLIYLPFQAASNSVLCLASLISTGSTPSPGIPLGLFSESPTSHCTITCLIFPQLKCSPQSKNPVVTLNELLSSLTESLPSGSSSPNPLAAPGLIDPASPASEHGAPLRSEPDLLDYDRLFDQCYSSSSSNIESPSQSSEPSQSGNPIIRHLQLPRDWLPLVFDLQDKILRQVLFLASSLLVTSTTFFETTLGQLNHLSSRCSSVNTESSALLFRDHCLAQSEAYKDLRIPLLSLLEALTQICYVSVAYIHTLTHPNKRDVDIAIILKNVTEGLKALRLSHDTEENHSTAIKAKNHHLSDATVSNANTGYSIHSSISECQSSLSDRHLNQLQINSSNSGGSHGDSAYSHWIQAGTPLIDPYVQRASDVSTACQNAALITQESSPSESQQDVTDVTLVTTTFGCQFVDEACPQGGVQGASYKVSGTRPSCVLRANTDAASNVTETLGHDTSTVGTSLSLEEISPERTYPWTCPQSTDEDLLGLD